MLSLLRQAGIILSTILFLSSQAYAINYPTLSNQDLYELKGAIKNAPEAEQKSYQKEWQLRLTKMTEEERKHYTSETEADKVPQAPIKQGRGYDSQGQGVIIYGGPPSGPGN
ncbi:MAG: hypothetical protein K9L30_13340 [Desulfobacterales bacterium]|nr:hypothetical protein [Desulfobacterales bacterium]